MSVIVAIGAFLVVMRLMSECGNDDPVECGFMNIRIALIEVTESNRPRDEVVEEFRRQSILEAAPQAEASRMAEPSRKNSGLLQSHTPRDQRPWAAAFSKGASRSSRMPGKSVERTTTV